MNTNLSKINLNLLVAFDILLKERHVTRAAKLLNLSQSAMSNILKQLRILFKDELFVRGQASSMIPTPLALELSKPIALAIEHINCVFLKESTFDPKTAKQHFILGLSDYTSLILLPHLVQFLAKEAPNITVTVQHLNYLTDSRQFENDNIDMAIGFYIDVPSELIARTIFTDRSVFVGWNKNPLFKKIITIEDYAKANQLIVLYYESRAKLHSEECIKKMGYERRVLATVPYEMSALYSLPNTNLICMAFERVAKKLINILPLKIQPVSFKGCSKCEIEMVWHPKNRNSPVHHWLRESIIEIAKRI